MKTYIFRNYTVEPLFGDSDAVYSGYGDISTIPADVERYIWFYQVPINADNEQLAREVADYGSRLEMVLGQVDAHKPFIVFTLVDLFGLRLTGNDHQVATGVSDFNRKVEALSQQHANVKVVDLSEFTSRYDAFTLVNFKYFYMSQTLLNPRLAQDFQQWWHRVEQELAYQRKKCLVLDLDNTLWGGVVGEDGTAGLKLGGDYPGNVYLMWQQSLLQLARQGVILAACSKNNLADVEDVWDNHPSVVLKRDAFSIMRINWNDKVTNLREIADGLNIDLSSLVFVDDNPAERELVKQMLPMVAVPDFPEKPYQLMRFFKQLVDDYFRTYSITAEDRKKTEQYRANARRSNLRSRMDTMEDYLRSLDMHLRFMPADAVTVQRVAQMSQKTNQFNLTTHRYTDVQVQQLLDEGWLMYCADVSDRFGDSGITVAALMRPIDDDKADIDTFMLSCRILGRGIEEAVLRAMFNDLRRRGVRRVTASYIPTARNVQTAEFYDRAGMTLAGVDDDGSRHYQMALDTKLRISDYYDITGL